MLEVYTRNFHAQLSYENLGFSFGTSSRFDRDRGKARDADQGRIRRLTQLLLDDEIDAAAVSRISQFENLVYRKIGQKTLKGVDLLEVRSFLCAVRI